MSVTPGSAYQSYQQILSETESQRKMLHNSLGKAIEPFLGVIPTLAIYREAEALAACLMTDFLDGLPVSLKKIGEDIVTIVECDVMSDVTESREARP